MTLINSRTILGKDIDPEQGPDVEAILDECWTLGVLEVAEVAYILATAKHESKLGACMHELYDGDPHNYFTCYDGRKDLGNDRHGDGYRFRGRGYVQITGKANYRRFGHLLGADLLSQPELVTNRFVAAQILVRGMRDGLFTGLKLADFWKEGKFNADQARHIINGNDRAHDIACIAQTYASILECKAGQCEGPSQHEKGRRDT